MIELEPLRQTLGPLAKPALDVRALAAAVDEPAPQAVRLAPGTDASELPFETTAVEWFDRGRRLVERQRPGAELPFAAGKYYVQDSGSLLAVAALEAAPGDHVLDLCAAPGGKSTAIADQLGDHGWLLCNEAVRSRHGALRLNLSRQGGSRYVIAQQDPNRLADWLGPCFDRVLVDAPCSGQSLVGRAKQTMAAFERNTVAHCAAREARILSAAARLLRPGGRLVYSTCTFAHAENEGQMADFLDRHPGWELTPLPHLARWSSPALPGCYRLWPHRDQCAGAFVAVLSKTADDAPPAALKTKTLGAGRHTSDSLPADWPRALGAWGRWDAGTPHALHDRILGWPESPPERWPVICYGGPEVAYRKGVTWFPAYALAMRRDHHWHAHQHLELDEQAARDYVAGQTIGCRITGWAVVRWTGSPLGWIKGDSRRAKNHLPKAARLSG